MSKNKKHIRLGEEKLNNDGCLMKIVEYNNANDIVVEFQDEYKSRTHTGYDNFLNGKVKNRISRLGEEAYNNQGCLMKIVEYNNANDITIEFQDEYKKTINTTYYCFTSGSIVNPMFHIGEERVDKNGNKMRIIKYNTSKDIIVEFQDEYNAKVHTQYDKFIKGHVKNPYAVSVCGVGIIGAKYPVSFNCKDTKEYAAWHRILERCFGQKTKERNQRYKDVTCCDEWLLFENFYEWLHSQSNFQKWLNGRMWAVDKDIIKKGNKIYSPDTCCLVPQAINNLFIRQSSRKNDLPIGVDESRGKFRSLRVLNATTGAMECSSLLPTKEDAFNEYKKRKESLIKHIAKIEYDNGNITNECFDSMMKYEIEIDD